MRKLSIWLLVTVAGGALLAGCGGSSKSTSASPANPTAATSTGAARPLTATQEVERCKHTVQALPTLSGSAKTKLTTSCERAGGGATAHSKLVHEVCFELAARFPPGPARVRAEKICHAP
jgi:hypothetical protein